MEEGDRFGGMGGGHIWWNGWEGVGVEDIFGGMGGKE